MRKGQTKTPQKQNMYEAQGRDLFQTPNYAVDLIVPFLVNSAVFHIWECASGQGKMVRRFEKGFGFKVLATDIADKGNSFNFLTDGMTFEKKANWAIVTNPPFSMQKKFFQRCLEYEMPFALLIPAVYSGWIIDACKLGAEKVIPTRRIDYITPNVLQRIHEGEIWETFLMYHHKEWKTLKNFQFHNMSLWYAYEEKFREFFNYKSIYEVPSALLRKYSSSDFHSVWLTMGLGIGKQETFVELSNEDKNNI